MSLYRKMLQKMDWKKFRKYMDIEDYEVISMKNGTEWKMCCILPDHHEKTPSFYLNIDLGLYRCFGCDGKSNFVVLISTVKGISTKQAFEKLKELSGISEDSFSVEEIKEKIKLLESSKEIAKEDDEIQVDNLPIGTKLTSECVKYLNERNISPEICSKFGLFYSDFGYYSNTIITPVKDLNNEFRTFESRQIRKGIEPKVRYPKRSNVHDLIFNYTDCLNYDYVIVVEGLMDALSLMSRGFFPNVCTAFGTSFSSSQLKAFSKFDKIVTVFDPDRAGKKATKVILEQLSSVSSVYIAKVKDKDPKYQTTKDLKIAVKNAIEFKDPSMGIVKDYISDLMETK